MKKFYPFIKVLSAFLLLIGFSSFINPIRQVYQGPLFFQKFVEVSLAPQNLLPSTHTLFQSLNNAPVLRMVHHVGHKPQAIETLESGIKSIDAVFQKRAEYVFVPNSVCQLRELGVQAYGLEYPLSSPVVVGVCYRDLSREQITWVEHPFRENGFDLGLYFNKDRFSTGVYSGVNFQDWMNFGDEDNPGISVLHQRGPYAGVEMSLRF